jgi:hypothetical protein
MPMNAFSVFLFFASFLLAFSLMFGLHAPHQEKSSHPLTTAMPSM